jgi:hypothetical protein
LKTCLGADNQGSAVDAGFWPKHLQQQFVFRKARKPPWLVELDLKLPNISKKLVGDCGAANDLP